MINGARSAYYNQFGENISNLSNDEIAKFISKLKADQKQELLFHSSNHHIRELNNKKLGLNTGNSGYLGRGLYFSDVPTSNYGHLQQPMIIKGNERKLILNDAKGYGSRITSDNSVADNLIAKNQKQNVRYNPKNKKFKTSTYSVYPGMSEGSKNTKEWNDYLNTKDAVYYKGTSKGQGYEYPEILIPENSNAKLKSLFPNVEVLKEAIKTGKITRNWDSKDLYNSIVPLIGAGTTYKYLKDDNN